MKEKLKALFVYFFGKKPDPAPEVQPVKSEPNINVVWTAGDPATSVPAPAAPVQEAKESKQEWNGWTKQEQPAAVVEKSVKKQPAKKSSPVAAPQVKPPSNKPANKKPRNRVKKATPPKTS